MGWLVLVGLLTFVVVVGLAWAGGQGGVPVPARTVSVMVHPGETLWSVAQRMAPGVPATGEVARIGQLNGLDVDAVLYPGELLVVPTSH
jgi:LysM repeat protein